MDRRVRLLAKTSGYGLATGSLVGAAVWAAGWGGYRNVLMGASSGMYVGILVTAYILATPTKPNKIRGNPFSPRQPVNPEDDQIPEEDFQSSFQQKEIPAIQKLRAQLNRPAFWMPIVKLDF